jgi:trk system potassium uptake protein TrkA
MAVTDSDEVNIIACLIASSQAKIPTKIARVREEAYVRGLQLFEREPLQINLCIYPEQEAAQNALKLMEFPGVREIAEFAQGQILLVGAIVDRNSRMVGRPLQDIQAVGTNAEKILIVALQRETQLIIPRGRDVIQPGDEVFIACERARIRSVLEALGKPLPPTRRIIIYGDTKVALYLARKMENRTITTKLICVDEKRCTSLVDEFNKVMVLHGEGTDQNLLVEENVKDVDYFISASDDEEANILVSLLAKRLGARSTMALVRRLPYLSLISSIGVDVVLNPQMAAVNRILRYVRRGKVLSVVTMGEDHAEAIEVVALETSDLVNHPLKEVRFPRDAIIGAVVHNGQNIIPDGETVIHPGDHVVIFAKRKAIPEVEQSLMVKLEYF